MKWPDWKKRLGLDEHARTAHFITPLFALELEPGFVVGAGLDANSRQVERVTVRELQAGALTPSPQKPNLSNEAAVRRAVKEVTEGLASSHGRLGLILPDVAVRVALLPFETLPERRRERDTLVRWRMREFLPFAPEEARISYQVLVKQPGQVEILCLAVRTSVLAEYETLLEGLNGGPALVLPASVALLPLLPDDKSGQLLLHLCPGALTAVIVGQDRVRAWRTRPLEGGPAENLAEVTREAARALATSQDHLSLEIKNVWFCARPPATTEMKDTLVKTLGRELLHLPGDFARGATLPAEQHAVFHHFGMPLAGLIANRQERR